ncbi:glycosyl hydrolase [Sphaerobacter sp.]|uniref:VPS10 domain-containing protein n=1 Tax=Sphaerobacter sp. TaxID=2099654 RepID=UPI001DBBCBC0|nr:glycosyl hydrolase [Sphaerobacter sp.]MBX5446102.1 glycosyl hydrolase [Sphaerobacter sp.]
MRDPQELLGATRWRLAGPYRGGRVVAVAADPVDPLTFYFGACAGGVWKSTDAGATWRNISDGFFKTASVGAIAVSEADPNVIYVGMGESCIRGNVSHGDGVYRSDDAGATWRHLGLAETRHIARVRIHPKNPDLVYVAAFGHAFGPNEERGVFRSKDGGQTWEKVLYRDENTGACDLSMDPNNPRVLYAAMWEARRSPWSLVSGGEGSGIFKTTDGGDTWVELTNNPGLPQGLKGRIGVAVSPAKPDRVWALIEAKDGGLFRSDDGGATWTRLSDNPELRQRPWYYMHIFADPVNPDVLYVLNLRFWKSIDGGATYIGIPTPHGDHHDLWIDPKNPKRMIHGNDGGACVSLDGGVTWSSIYNQPTAQFYHVTTDTQFPYRIYGAQQDNTTLSIPSYSDRGVITADDTYPVGGGESGYIAVRPDDPNIVYAGSYASRMTRYDHRSRQEVDITVWPDDPIGYGAESMKYRVQWTFPIHLSPHDPNVLYVGANHLLRSTDGGQSFEEISPDLTRGEPETLKPSGGPITKDNVSTEFYGTIFAFAESPVQQGVLWTGSDDGLIHVSRDNGKTWENVTPDLPEWALISIIEASPHDAATAYVAATRYKLDDFRPYLLKTNDYGKTWQPITNGIPEDDFTRVIREDPVRRGLLYCGTETGLYVSFDDGANWHRVTGNLPVVPIHDLVIHDTDLILATHGRSFWVLDDLSALRAWPDIDPDAPGTLFPVRPAYRLMPPRRWPESKTAGYKSYITAGGNQVLGEIVPDGEGGTRIELRSAGENPPVGVLVQYRIGVENPKSVALSFYTADGKLIKRIASDDEKAKGPKPKAKPGVHRFVWDMRYPDGVDLEGVRLAAYWGGGVIGPKAVPGTYEVRLEIDGQEVGSQQFEIRKDPRISATQEDLQAQFDLLMAIQAKLSSVHETVLRSQRLREQIAAWQERLRASGQEALAEEAGKVVEKLAEAENYLVEWRHKGGADAFNYPPKVNSKLASLQGTVSYADARPTEQAYGVFEYLSGWADEGIARLNALIESEIGALNAKIAESGIPPLG